MVLFPDEKLCIFQTAGLLLLYVLHYVFSGCGFCKKLKPDYTIAATELKGHSVSKCIINLNR